MHGSATGTSVTEALRARLQVEALHVQLCQRIAALPSPLVADVMRVFLEVSSLASEQGLWSLAFAFDEDDGRVARAEARFWDGGEVVAAGASLRGYEVQLVLPRVFPVRSPADRQKAADKVLAMAAEKGSLVTRFVHALTELGAYRTIEPLELVSAEAHLL